MIYLKSVLAGIAGSILVVIMFVIVVIVLNVAGLVPQGGMVGISVFSPLLLAIVALGFVAGFYLVFRKSRLRRSRIHTSS
jgi:membrane-bound ClpP family serine protease